MLAFGLLALVQVTLILAITVVSVALPAIAHDLTLNGAGLVLLNAAYGISFGGLLLLGGRLADRVGRRRSLVIGMAIFGLASVAAGGAPSLNVLLAARLAQGGGAALAAPAALALVGTLYPGGARRTRALAIWGGLAPAGAVLGTVFSGVFVTLASWRWTFAVPAAVAAVVMLAGPRLLPESPAHRREPLDLPGAALATIGIGALCWGLAMAGERSHASAAVLIPLALAAAALAALVRVEARAPAPLIPPSLLAPASRRVALFAVFLAAAGSAMVLFFFSLYFQQVHGFSPIATSAAFLPFGFALVAAGPLASWLVTRVPVQVITALGLALGVVGLLLLARIGLGVPYAGAVLAGLVVFPLGLGLTFSGATVAAVGGALDTEAGIAGAVVNVALETGPPVGLALLVALATARTTRLGAVGLPVAAASVAGYSHALIAAALAFLLCAALALTVMAPTSAPAMTTRERSREHS